MTLYTKDELLSIGFIPEKGENSIRLHDKLINASITFIVPEGHHSGASTFILESWRQTFLLNNLYHCEYGPAILYEDGDCMYCINGVLHRYEGPARNVGSAESSYRIQDYFIRGKHISTDEYLSWIKNHDMDIDNLSDNDKTLIDIRWAQ